MMSVETMWETEGGNEQSLRGIRWVLSRRRLSDPSLMTFIRKQLLLDFWSPPGISGVQNYQQISFQSSWSTVLSVMFES